MMEIINTPQYIHQNVMKKSGHMLSTYLGNDVYWELRVVEVLVRWLGNDYLDRELAKEGKDWSKIQRQINDLTRNIQRAKQTYDLIEDKKFSQIKKDIKLKEDFLKYTSKIPIFDSPLTFMLIWCIKRTSLQNSKVLPDDLKRLEDTGFMKMAVKKVSPSSTTESSSGT